jgi:hypothetical protein
MTGQDPGSVFNIGSQHGNISNVAGDMTSYGSQQYNAPPPIAIGHEIARLQQAISAMGLDPRLQRSASELLADAQQRVDQPRPDAKKIARPIERLTKLLKEPGLIAAGGAALIGPLQQIAVALGTSGQAILHLIS